MTARAFAACIPALAVALSGCGRELHRTVDAPPADTEIDTTIPNNGEPPSDAVTLTITRRGIAVGGARIVFQAPDGALISAALSDVNGRAWAQMPAGGYVTAIEKLGMNLDQLNTFASVAAGDDLRLDYAELGDGNTATLSVVVPTDTGADSYLVSTSCGTGGVDATGTGDITITSCTNLIDVVVQSMFEGSPTGRAIYAGAQPVPATGALTLTGTYTPLEQHTLTYTNVPPQVASIAGFQAISPERRAYHTADVAIPTAGTATVQLNMPGTTGGLLTVSTLYPTPAEIGQQELYEWSMSSTTYTADLASVLLPAYATVPAYDVAAHTVTWTERPGGAAPDAVRVGLQIYRDDIPAGRAWRWKIAAARGSSTSVAFPRLPAPPTLPFDYNPTTTDSVAIDELMTVRLPGGFAPWRATIFEPPGHAVGGASGRIVIQTLAQQEL